jgi:hypothetical protein
VIRAVGAALVAALVFAAAAPAVADEQVRLRTTAVFSQATYLAGDDVRLVLTVENAGTVAVDDVSAVLSTELSHDPAALGALAPAGPRLPLAPGATFGVEVPMLVTTPTDRLRVDVAFSDGSAVMAEAPVTAARGSLAGLIYGDRDYDEVVDPGEELVGGGVSLVGPGDYYGETRVDQRGAFTFQDLAAGDYYAVVGHSRRVRRAWRAVASGRWLGCAVRGRRADARAG